MVAVLTGSSVRSSSRKPGVDARGPRCSCALLAELVRRPAVRDCLADLGVPPDELIARQPKFHEGLEAEPADWRLRLQQRAGRTGGRDADLDQLLAIARSADCHGYALLEDLGIAGARLRKHVIDRMRDLGSQTVSRPTPAPTPPSRPARTARGGLSPRRASARRRLHPAPETVTDPAGESDETATEDAEVSTHGNGAVRSPLVPSAAPQRQARPRRQPSARTAADAELQSETRPATKARPETDDRPRPIDPECLPPLLGREHELARLADALLRQVPRAPVLAGSHGSGRTTLAMHLARVLSRPVFRLEATAYDEEEALAEDLEIVAEQDGVAILDDVDRVPGDLPPPFLGPLTQAWGTNRPPILTVLSDDGRARLDSWLPGVSAALDVLDLAPLKGGDLHAAVDAGAPAITAQHGVELSADLPLTEITRLAERYLAGLSMPGRALDLLDLGCARTVREGETILTRERLLGIVCERSGVPRERLDTVGHQDMLNLEAELAKRVVGHETAIHTIAQLIRRNRAGFSSHRPVASVLLLGPSGVGKTEIAKTLCEALFERGEALVRLDMSEYAEPHAVARVVGAPPGYVGHEQGGTLTDPLLRQPHCVVLLDEIEKAHRDVHQLLLQVFDEGQLTDGRGRTVDFRHAVVIMTSNLGAEHIVGDDAEADEQAVLTAARGAFPLELWNRIEAPLVMHPLDPHDLERICQRLARASSERLFRERGIRYVLGDGACAHLVALAGDDPGLGARPLRHLLSREVESVLADAILRGQLRPGTQTLVDAVRGEIVLR